MLDALLVIAGLALLVVCADLFVRGAVWAAIALGVSPMVVGLTLVAFGTSAPELSSSLIAALEGRPGFASGNVLGSNFANLGLILGMTAVVAPIRHDSRSARFEIAWLLALGVAVFPPMLSGAVSRWYGALLVLGLVVFTTWLVHRELHSRPARRREQSSTVARDARSVAKHVALIVGGLGGVIWGGDLLVRGAVGIATSSGMSDTLIGITIFAVGTSLPELVTSVVAARKGQPEIALGNVLGSNIFNIGLVLGSVACTVPMPLSWAGDGPVAGLGLLLSIVVGLSLRTRGGIGRRVGIALLTIYFGYMAIAAFTL